MDTRISTALIAARDTAVVLLGYVPVGLVLVAVLLYRFAAGGEYSSALQAAAADIERDPIAFAVNVRWELLSAMVALTLWTLVAGWWFRRSRPVDGWEAVGVRKLPWHRAVPTGIAVGLGAMFVRLIVAIPTVLIMGFDRSDLEQTDIQALSQFGGVFFLLFVALVAGVAPFAEELFFRGHLFRWSASRCGTSYAYVLSATIFALVHFHPALIPMHLAVGLVFCWSYDRWRTLSVPITAHATVNAFGILPFVFA